MKPALLDTNVLIALAWPNHVHHGRALAWFRTHGKDGWATCPLTQSGFVRISSNRSVMPDARTPREAIDLLRQITGLAHHRFWSDDTSITRSEHVARQKLVGYRQVSDAHLLAVALRHHGRLATFDAGIRQLVPDGYLPGDVVCLLTEN